uniref:(northern house mosquito) hypothetical protein n=1 Tax=Culex pipiens TaxID=7175 RepID=A0A8D8CJR5_CULPI
MIFSKGPDLRSSRNPCKVNFRSFDSFRKLSQISSESLSIRTDRSSSARQATTICLISESISDRGVSTQNTVRLGNTLPSFLMSIVAKSCSVSEVTVVAG